MSIKLKNVETKVIEERTELLPLLAPPCGSTQFEVLSKSGEEFQGSMEFHLSVLKEKTIQAVA